MGDHRTAGKIERLFSSTNPRVSIAKLHAFSLAHGPASVVDNVRNLRSQVLALVTVLSTFCNFQDDQAKSAMSSGVLQEVDKAATNTAFCAGKFLPKMRVLIRFDFKWQE